MRYFPMLGASATMIIAAVGLAGWLLRIERLTNWSMPHARMSSVTAAGLELASLSLLLLARTKRPAFVQAVALAAAACACIMAPLALAFDATTVGHYLSPATATSLTLVGSALVLRGLGKHRLGISAALTSGLIAATDLIAWMYGVPEFTNSFRLMALPTATGVFLISAAIVAASVDDKRPALDWLELTLAKVPARPFLLAVVGVPPLVMGLALAGWKSNLYSAAFGQVVFTSVTIVCLIALVLRTIDQIVRLDREREAAHRAALKSANFAAAIQEREHRIRELAEAVPQIVWTTDPNGSIDWYNHRWYDFTGQTAEQAAGWGWQAAYHRDDLQRMMDVWPDSIRSGRPCDIDVRLQGKDGKFRWFLSRIVPLHSDDGSIIRWYGTATDIDAQKQAMERSQRIAQTLQEVFLPKELPVPRDMRIDAVYRSAERDAQVGGDWFDAVELPDGRLMFSIGDVAGHGLAAAVTVGRVCQTIFTLAFEDDDPARVLTKVNGIVRHQEESQVTALLGFVDADRRTLRYACAGHPSPVVATPRSRAAALPYGGLPLGTQADPLLETHTIAIARDAVVVVFTDGVIEFSRNIEEGQRLLLAGIDRLARDSSIARPAAALLEAVVGNAPSTDDAALLVIRFNAGRASTVEAKEPDLTMRWRFHSSDAHTARTSRQELTKYVESLCNGPEGVFDTELILGELLANTVEHAPGLVQIEIDWTDERPVIIVQDTGPGLDKLEARLPGDTFAEDGRGLFLIAALADDVQVRPASGFGTEMRIVLPVRRDLHAPNRRKTSHLSLPE